MSPRRRRSRLSALLLAVTLIASGCGSSNPLGGGPISARVRLALEILERFNLGALVTELGDLTDVPRRILLDPKAAAQKRQAREQARSSRPCCRHPFCRCRRHHHHHHCSCCSMELS